MTGQIVYAETRFRENNPFPNTGWWVWVFPCAVLVLILVCVNLVGDALDESFNPTA